MPKRSRTKPTRTRVSCRVAAETVRQMRLAGVEVVCHQPQRMPCGDYLSEIVFTVSDMDGVIRKIELCATTAQKPLSCLRFIDIESKKEISRWIWRTPESGPKVEVYTYV